MVIRFEPNRTVYTDEQKREMYLNGEYVFYVPDVTTGQWTDADWIKYIDNAGGWRPRR